MSQLVHRLSFIVVVFALLLGFALSLVSTPPRCTIGAGDDLGCARGFQTRESDGRRTFRWTDDSSWIALSGAGWGGPRALVVTLAAPRPNGSPSPLTTLSAGGQSVTVSPSAQARRYALLLPPALPGSDTLSLSIQSETFTPPREERDLGVAVYEARLLPLTTPAIPGLLPALSLAVCGIALLRLTGQLQQRQSPLLVLLALCALSLCWWALPGRVVPFLPGLALLLGVAAWALPKLGVAGLPQKIWAATLAGSALDALIVTGGITGHWIVLAVAIQAALVVWAVAALHQPAPLGSLFAVALIVRLAGWAARILAGSGAADPDTELFYNYGRATIEIGVPVVEYPSGALAVWALLALPASRELFALFLPLVNLAADLAIVWGISAHKQAIVHRPLSIGVSLAIAYAVTPLLLPFWHAKYDPLPAALTVAGVALFARGRYAWSGAALGIGGTIKWAPWLAAPILGWYLLTGDRRPKTQDPRSRRVAEPQNQEPMSSKDTDSEPQATSHQLPAARRHFIAFILAGAGAILALSLPFALRDLAGFLTPYTVQGARPLIGESVWFLPALLIEPSLLASLTAPWSGADSAAITPTLTLSVQAAALLGLWVVQIIRQRTQAQSLSALNHTLALAALAPAIFLMLNRVFSPQYLLPISASLLVAGAAMLTTRRQIIGLAAGIAAMQAANLLVWPYYTSFWLIASVVLFTLGIGLTLWLVLSRPPSVVSSQ
jgi:hypothetical protein